MGRLVASHLIGSRPGALILARLRDELSKSHPTIAACDEMNFTMCFVNEPSPHPMSAILRAFATSPTLDTFSAKTTRFLRTQGSWSSNGGNSRKSERSKRLRLADAFPTFSPKVSSRSLGVELQGYEDEQGKSVTGHW